MGIFLIGPVNKREDPIGVFPFLFSRVESIRIIGEDIAFSDQLGGTPGFHFESLGVRPRNVSYHDAGIPS